ncbi:glucose uptake protein [Agrilactobacillus composti DSM 18527 = JCM 14202]|uniref:Glucose uptake protein n=1 Tax=Agrilactobacillus composti DSM 18527 = JCM 14202 TaxID=1423734 RepID=A0A0R1XUH0_9LACO|nr:GRP family sugar transporter [Agrilactobacillus composti]KRM33553.1 glucose uptake protein [Agrilactobacillus composti DSM 18527 = JCM 14202]
MNILVALIPAIAWGSIGLISGKLGGNPYQQTLGMTLGAFVFSVGLFLVVRPYIDLKILIVGLLSGMLWAVGQGNQFRAMTNIGISKAVPMSTGMQLFFNTLAGVLVFHEWQTTKQISLGSIALILLITGATFTSLRDKHSVYNKDSDGTEFSKGLRALIISTAGYLGYTVIVKWGNFSNPVSIILPQSIGMVIGGLILARGQGKNPWAKPTAKNILTGITWGIGNAAMFIAMSKVGLAISYSLAQTGIIISTIGSIVFLGEHKSKRELFYTVLGCLLVIAGGVSLGFVQ